MTLSPCTIEYLQQAKDFLLTNPKFKYDAFISEYDQEKDCGTCCCLLGWSPAFSPNFNKWKVIYVWGQNEMYLRTQSEREALIIRNELDGLFVNHHEKLGIEMYQVTTHHILEEIERLLS